MNETKTQKKETNSRRENTGSPNFPKSSKAKQRGGKRDKTKALSNKQNTSDARNTSISSGKLDAAGTLSASNRDNDPNWYFLDRNVAEQAASFSINGFNGVTLDIYGINHPGTVTDGPDEMLNANVRIPTIYSVEIFPTPGDTDTIQRGINLAALATYSTLSSINAKSTSYAPQDLTMLMLSLGEVISIMEHMRRMFGVAFSYNQRNRAMPYTLLKSMGVDPDDFFEHIAAYRLEFNSLVTSINKIPFPANISYLFKCADLYQKVYLDSASDMAQIIYSKPGMTWKLNETYNDQGSGLETIDCTTLTTFPQWFQVAKSMVDALLQSATFNFIYSDILNLSSKTSTKLFYMDYLTEQYIVIPEYNANYLLQIHNATIIDYPKGSAATDYYTKLNDVSCSVNKNSIVYKPIFKMPTFIAQSAIVDFMTDSPSVEDRIEATRFTIAPAYNYGSNFPEGMMSNNNLPDHAVARIGIYQPMLEDGTIPVNYFSASCTDVETLGAGNGLALAKLTPLDWAPIILIFDQEHKTANLLPTYVSGDVNYYATLDSLWFSRVNDITFQALFMLR